MKRYFEVHTFSTSLKSNQTMASPCSLWNIGFVNNDFSFLLLLVEFCDENELDLLHNATTIKHFFYFVNCQCSLLWSLLFHFHSSHLVIADFIFFICLAFPNKPLNTQERERVRHVYSYSYVVCWQKQTKELMRFVWINNNFTHSCFIISHSSSAIIRNIASSLSSLFIHESLWELFFVCLQFLKIFFCLFFIQ